MCNIWFLSSLFIQRKISSEISIVIILRVIILFIIQRSFPIATFYVYS